MLDRLNLLHEFRLIVAISGIHNVFFHVLLAHTCDDSTNFQGNTDRLGSEFRKS